MNQVGPGDYQANRSEKVKIQIDPRDGAAGLVRAAHNGKSLGNSGSIEKPEFNFVIQGEVGETDVLVVWYEFPANTPAGAHFAVELSSGGSIFKDRPITNRSTNATAVVRKPSYLFEVI